MLEQKKMEARKEYKEAKENYFKNMSNENWIKFCDAKRNCRLLGVRI